VKPWEVAYKSKKGDDLNRRKQREQRMNGNFLMLDFGFWILDEG
jgi:hypothetical protein